MVESTPLVTCDWLADHLNEPGVRVIEVSASPNNSSYLAGHIPGAVWWFWKDALWHPTDREFVTPDQLGERLGSIGVSPGTTLVIYGDPVQFGTYAFWVLTMSGHKNLRFLDGGRKRWVAEGRSLSQEIPDYPPAVYPSGTGDKSRRIGRDEIRARLGQPGRILLDLRSPQEYQGERVSPPSGEVQFDVDHGAERGGHIPGAVHLFFRELLQQDDTFHSPEELKAILSRANISPDSSEEIITYCRLSHRATVAWFAMQHLLNMEKVRVYDGSWTEWGSIVGFPIEKG
ncbi:MAG: sulfurtransferase [Chloroflexi bacterium]|nr:sulfurtransferase [Chloroflexota bacterium]